MDDFGPLFEQPPDEPSSNGSMTVAEARMEFQRSIRERNTTCPVCDRRGKWDGRPLNVTMVRSLLWLWRKSDEGREWVNVPQEMRRDSANTYDFSKQYSTLRHWGFLEHRALEEGSTNKESGVWRPTQRAGRFLRGEIEVPERVWTYNAACVDISDDLVHVADIVEGFDYRRMMTEHWVDFQWRSPE